MGLTVSEKSAFPTSFGGGRFQGNLLLTFMSTIFIIDSFHRYCDYLCEISLKANMTTDGGNGRNEM